MVCMCVHVQVSVYVYRLYPSLLQNVEGWLDDLRELSQYSK